METADLDPDAGAWAFLFDFDGTLVDIAAAPDEVEVPPDLGRHLAALAERNRGAVAIITGRRIADIDRLLAPYRPDVVGVHGGELRVGSRTMSLASGPDAALAALGSEAAERFKATREILIEDKGNSLAFHWRRLPSLEPEVMDFLAAASRRLGDGYRIQLGKAVAEILPSSTTKGSAIARLLATGAYGSRRPIYFGDDLTDESAFDAANRAGGTSVRIGAGPTSALNSLPDVQALRKRLAGWAQGEPLELRKDFGS
jgi:trehalose 6-phosphate phosphatase